MQSITVKQGYLASYYFLDWIYFNVKKNNDLGSLLSEMNPNFVAEMRPPMWHGGISADPATWFEWLDCVYNIVPNVKTETMPELQKISADDAFETMIQFLLLYEERDLYHTKWLIDALRVDQSLRAKWDECLQNCNS